MPQTGQFDPVLLLGVERAHLVQNVAPALNGDQQITLRWEIPLGSFEECRAWAKANRRTLKNFIIEGKSFDTIWRTVLIEVKDIESKDRKGGQLLHTLAKGYITSLVTGGSVDWTEARWSGASQAVASPGNSQDVSSVSDTQSDSPARILFVEWRNVAPERMHAILGSLSATEYTDPSVDGETISGEFHRIMQSSRKEDDGSGTITLVLGQPQFTLKGFTDLLKVDAQDVYYLWDVPKSLAQEVMDAWRAAGTENDQLGRGASASFNAASGLVDITLIARGGMKDNLTQDVNARCDTTETYHFLWGATKIELGAFLDDHNSAAGSGFSRQVQVSLRNGLFDAIVIERQTTYDAAKHLYTITLGVGSGITRAVEWGWNLPMTTLDAKKTAIQQKNGDRVTTTFTINRKDECSFDYTATADTRTLVGGAAAVTGTGINVTAKAWASLVASDLALQVGGAFTSGPRKRHDVSMQAAEDGTFAATARESVVVKIDDRAIAPTPVAGLPAPSVRMGRNVDTADLPEIALALGRSVTLDLDGNEDGTFNWTARIVDDAASTGSGAVAVPDATTGIARVVYFGRAETKLNVTNLLAGITSTRRMSVDLDIDPRPDGLVDYRITTTTIAKSSIIMDTGNLSKGVRTIVDSGNAADPLEIVALGATYASAARRQVSMRVDARDDGSFGYALSASETKDPEFTAYGGTVIEKVTIKSGLDRDSLPVEVTTDTAPARGVAVALQMRPQPDGSITYDVVKTEKRDPDGISTTAKAGTIGMEQDLVFTQGAVPAEVLGSYGDQGVTVEVGADIKEDGSVEHRLVTNRRKQLDGIAAAKKNPRAVRSRPYTERIDVFSGAKAIPAGRGDAFWFEALEINQDGTYNGRLHQLSYQDRYYAAVLPQGNVQLSKRVYNRDHTQYRDIIYTYARSVRLINDGPNAWYEINGGLEGSDVAMATVDGVDYWVSTTITISSEGEWTAI